jgi:hypothetical protein
MLLDKFALLTMLYTPEGYEELKQDIRANGQLVPVILRKGAILDGRHRNKACEELGIKLKFKDVGNVTDEEALDVVISNAIKKDTNTDAAKTEAYLICKAKGLKNKEMPNLFKRLNKNYVDKISFIEKENPKYLEAVLAHKHVRLYNKEYDKVENYGTINGIWKTLKMNKQLENEVVVVESTVDETPEHKIDLRRLFNNTNAEKEYWELYYLGKEQRVNLHPSSSLGRKIVELIKFKHFQDPS